jgi:hypothetical protein
VYADSSPLTARRSLENQPRRRACQKPAPQTAAPVERSRTVQAARRSRLDDAIVAQWLLDQTGVSRRLSR